MGSGEQAPLLRVDITTADDGRAVIALAGEVDVTSASQVTTAVDDAVGTGTPEVIELDFGAVTFMDSSGLGAVIHAHRVVTGLGGTLVLGPRSPIVDRLFDVSGVERALGDGAADTGL